LKAPALPPHFRQALRCLYALVVFSILFRGQTVVAAESGQTIIALGDVHGNFDGLCDILKRAGLIDVAGHTVQKNT
jgi:hypothetical protein